MTTLREYDLSAKSTDVFGRVALDVRQHHFFIDGPVQNGCPGEEITPPEAVLGGVAACGVELIQVIAKENGKTIGDVSIKLHAWMDRAKQKRTDVTLLNAVRLDILIAGTDQATAVELVNGFKRRCPLFGMISVAVEDVKVEVRTTA